MRKNYVMVFCLLALLPFVMTACRSQEPKSGEKDKLKVVASLYPIYDFTRQIGRDKVDVTLLLPPGVEAHAFEPRPADMARIEQSDCLIFTGHAMEPWVDRLLQGITSKKLLVIDASRSISLRRDRHTHDGKIHQASGEGGGHPTEGADPHIWLDFANAMTMVDTIAAGLADRDPANKIFYLKNAEAYKLQLGNLDLKFVQTLASCQNKVLIHAGHMIFGYLADRYGLTYISAYQGFSPNAEPTPKRMAELTQKIKKYHVKAIYYEELVKPGTAEALAKETGVALLMLHGAHNMTREEIKNGVTFIQLMEANLDNLKRGLPCP